MINHCSQPPEKCGLERCRMGNRECALEVVAIVTTDACTLGRGCSSRPQLVTTHVCGGTAWPPRSEAAYDKPSAASAAEMRVWNGAGPKNVRLNLCRYSEDLQSEALGISPSLANFLMKCSLAYLFVDACILLFGSHYSAPGDCGALSDD